MAIKMSEFVNPNGFSILVNFPVSIQNVTNNAASGYVLDQLFSADTLLLTYLKEKTNQSEEKILKSLQLVKLKSSLSHVSISSLTRSEAKRLQLAELLLIHSKVFVLEHFFEGLIYSEREYFKRFFRNLMNKQGISMILLENDMNFVSETVKQFYLFTTKEKYQLVTDFYDDEIYKYVDMPFTVELVKYFESKGHFVDHDVTFNETLKAIYRGVS